MIHYNVILLTQHSKWSFSFKTFTYVFALVRSEGHILKMIVAMRWYLWGRYVGKLSFQDKAWAEKMKLWNNMLKQVDTSN